MLLVGCQNGMHSSRRIQGVLEKEMPAFNISLKALWLKYVTVKYPLRN